MRIADLHVHTTASDGRWTIPEILSRATARNMSAVAITNHDTVDGLEELCALQKAFPVEIIPGIEFNTDADNLEIHILGYYIDIGHKALRKTLLNLRNGRMVRIREMVSKLNELGYALEFADIITLAGESKALGRPHIAAALIKKGYFSSSDYTLYKLFAKGGPAYVPHYKLSPFDAIDIILEAGGIPVLAHPGLVGNDYYLRSLVAHGLQGLEVYHPKHDKAMTNHYNQIARNNNLLITGGSDFHGIPGRFPEDLGEFGIPYHFVQELNERHCSRI
jgi:predicted metal-dependent phosphoesterase TrpH